MYLKKIFFVLFLVLFVVMFSVDCKGEQSEVGEKAQFVERSDAKVWRGEIMATPIRCFGPYAKIKVKNPVDNQDYQFQLEVIYKANNGPARIGLQNLNVGDEILFFKTFVIAKTKERAMYCPIGIYYSYSLRYRGESIINGHKVANPPKKK
ncbi:hypothetical protein KKF60_00115 [Patescibacteria group bacterium]|nr:hypothetical protein [Patescibacteria group bacterium]MBU4458307.1 hypothetical protein [Patescibacteria group bacterium]MCG2695938.1 hypothetical protein [Candidatus Portnoybacteria bacterium]